jgi:Fur family transcriptional regulator, ferric uptake regulator
MTQSAEEVLTLLRQGGGRMTTSRRLLVEVLFQTPYRHRTAEDLVAEVNVRAPDVSISTIYRNLDELERIGAVTHAHLGHGPVTYQLASFAHAHLVCEVCGSRFDAPDELFGGIARSAKKKMGFTIDPHHLAVMGRCQDCS